MKKIAFIGSSGGNLFKQGGNDIHGMMKEILLQTGAADMEISAVQYILASSSLDTAGPDSSAKLYTWKNGELYLEKEGTLSQINKAAVSIDEQIAEMIRAGEIDGVMFVSAEPDKINHQSFQAAIDTGLPLAGTGGSSVAKVQSMGGKVLSASGTTGTTNRTRAVAFATAFAKEWNIRYQPVIGNTGAHAAEALQTNIWKRINFRGIMMTSLPAFIAMALCLAISQISVFSSLSDVFDTLVAAIPVVICAIAAKQVSGLDEVGVVAGIVAGVLSVDGGIIGGLVVGIAAGIFSYYISIFCFRHNIPGTTVNIAAGGLGGLAAGLIGMYLISPVTLWLGNLICDAINAAIGINPLLAGALAGVLIWPAIIGGVYHAAILPIVLLEMEEAGFSFLGAIDMTGLVMVSAGITLANVIFPKDKGQAAAALPGFLVNVCFGTFVEASYPFMFSSRIVFAGALLSAGVSGALVGLFDVRGTAYVPSVLAPAMANEGHGVQFLICMLVAATLAFVITSFANLREKGRKSVTSGS